MLCSDTKVLLLFVHDELQFKRSFQLKIGRYRLYISAEANNYVVNSKLNMSAGHSTCDIYGSI